MPRRKKYIKFSKLRRGKAKAYRRRYTRRRLRKGKKTRRRFYHKKKYRTFSKTYGLRKYAGIKWTRYLSLAEFLIDDKWDLQWLYCLSTYGDRIIYSDGTTNFKFTEDILGFSNRMARLHYMIYSTDLWSNKTMQVSRGYQNYICWKAYNPVPSQHNLGPLFNIYTSQYKKMKYVGVKVKWIPGIDKTSTFFPGYTIDTRTAPTQPSIPYQLTAAATGGQASTLYPDVLVTTADVDVTANTFHGVDTEHTHICEDENLDGIVTHQGVNKVLAQPPALRLWVNFDKQGYESQEFKVNCIEGSNLISTNANFASSRIRLGKVFTDDGFKVAISDKLIKSYSLLKPFKFFVRPKMSLKFNESIENETVAMNAEDSTTIMDSAISSMVEQNASYIQNNKHMPYLSVLRTVPNGTLTVAPIDKQSVNNLAIQLVRTAKSDGYFDPILFSWGLSCDNIEFNENLDYFRFYESPKVSPTDTFNFIYRRITDPVDFKGYGKFKVTYYCRFKDFNPLQAQLTPTSQAILNGMLENEWPTLPKS